jgi:hypothetical protein
VYDDCDGVIIFVYLHILLRMKTFFLPTLLISVICCAAEEGVERPKPKPVPVEEEFVSKISRKGTGIIQKGDSILTTPCR